ncbi:hypothetical protein ACVR1N_00780 [Streptococcus constellatus subsp. pharyngis]|uniref:Uncharacterized protein n=1 Tax=Streptococcus constellatus subsp. pharyngis SK1060 = CCUG 46377 TaxID=1035184 RepID=F9P526_STRCV|nr:hypothetical protein [Streptococcus constellatus]AGU72437.1 hypothetical protein SCRE_0586 [Streptococcus constellatus subsp. pharyngis C232]AGU74193.1 hypothetical protein SCR2_0586 [Streptococcus constellatus subsp. pharyngis C818]AGU79561.1 hypothetical protein SCI_0606 [Streptococcus constellatus subsp. pharyngis C1050]EGV10813.1 hypothetical protein HMPREF1042_0575 [Streptococcus constellatus subsp. pharyngis SK1060 = CCUG 46377]QRP81880.1 hypothetical protein I6J38_00905 [Streptococcu
MGTRITYVIKFSKGVTMPDLATSPIITQHLTIKLKNVDGFVVDSNINDVKLRELIMATFNLEKKDVIVLSKFPGLMNTL